MLGLKDIFVDIPYNHDLNCVHDAFLLPFLLQTDVLKISLLGTRDVFCTLWFVNLQAPFRENLDISGYTLLHEIKGEC